MRETVLLDKRNFLDTSETPIVGVSGLKQLRMSRPLRTDLIILSVPRSATALQIFIHPVFFGVKKKMVRSSLTPRESERLLY